MQKKKHNFKTVLKKNMGHGEYKRFLLENGKFEPNMDYPQKLTPRNSVINFGSKSFI